MTRQQVYLHIKDYPIFIYTDNGNDKFTAKSPTIVMIKLEKIGFCHSKPRRNRSLFVRPYRNSFTFTK